MNHTDSQQGSRTRIIVKNLPKYIDQQRFREHFAERGDVTDVKLLRTKDGRSRCFGFVGYKTAEDAQAAIKFFNKSYFDTARLELAMAEPFKTIDKQQMRPWSKHSKSGTLDSAAHPHIGTTVVGGQTSGSNEKQDKQGKGGKRRKQDVLEDKIKEHPRLAEFQEVMKPKSKSQTFTNSEIASAQPVNVSIAAPAMDDINRPPRHGELRARHLPNEKGEDWDKDDPDTHGSDGLEDVLDDSISDTEYLRRRMKYFEAEGHNDDGIASDDPPGGISNAHEDGQEETHDIFSSDPAAKIAQTGRLFFRNLPYVATDIELQELCLPFGAVSDATVVRDRATGKSKGFAVVSFAAPADAVAAYQALDASIFQGRLIHVLPGNRPKAEASPVESAKTHEGRRGTRSFKAEAEAKRRADAGNRSAWSSYYMRDDTVAEAIADLTGISKAELLSPDAADAAVRLALGEAQVLAHTKAELSKAGVNVAALDAAAEASGSAATSKSVARSTTVLLVKNLPYSCTEDEIHDLFAKFGVVLVVLPSTRALALVELTDKQAARAAFQALAYKRFQHTPIYLEYAPAGIFEPSHLTSPTKDKPQLPTDRGSLPALDGEVATGVADADAVDEAAEACSLYVKNLSFESSAESVRRLFDQAASSCGGCLRAVRLVSSQRPDGKVLPKGYGFVELADHDTAKAVLKKLQGAVLDGHRLELQLSNQKQAPRAAKKISGKEDRSETKILVRNLAFEATAKDVRGLMNPFGHVKTCRLPKKFDGSTRGFAFVEFATKGEAQNAVRSVHHTHLYGRRLLVEYAEGEAGVDELRAKAAAKIHREEPENKPPRKRQKGVKPSLSTVKDKP